MKKKKIIGIVLTVLGVMVFSGDALKTYLRLQEGLSVVPTRGLFSEMLTFMVLVGGILLLINFKKKNSENAAIEPEENSEAQSPSNRNLICTTALVFAILSMVISNTPLSYTIIYFFVSAISLALGIVGLKLALSRNEKGEGFAKWAITAGAAAFLALASFGIKTNLEEKYVVEKNQDVYTQVKEAAEIEEKAKKEVENLKKLLGETDKDAKEKATSVYSKGLRTENGYESEFLDLRFNMPSGWVMASEDEIVEKFGSVAAEQVEMVVTDLASGSTVQVIAEKLFVKGATLEQYKEAIKTNWENLGYEFEEDKPSVTFCGKTYDVMAFNIYDYLKVDMYVRKQDDRIIYIAKSYTKGNEAVVDTALNAFEAY